MEKDSLMERTRKDKEPMCNDYHRLYMLYYRRTMAAIKREPETRRDVVEYWKKKLGDVKWQVTG